MSIFTEVRMKKLVFLLMLLVPVTQQAQTQPAIAGDWRAVTVIPDGTPDAAVREFNLELKANSSSVSATVTGISASFRDGRIEGNTVTLSGVNPDNNNQAFTMTGNLTGDEIVFNVVGVLPQPFHFVARRITKVEIGGSVSDAALMQQLLKEFK